MEKGNCQFISIEKSIVQIAGINWITIAYEKYSRLLLAQEAISIRPYDCNFVHEVWETCSLRHYLNTKFLNKFNPMEKEKLIMKKLNNPKNPLFGTFGGVDTYDLVFILSFYELAKYITPIIFSSNIPTTFNLPSNDQPPEKLDINIYEDNHNKSRIALYQKEPVSWWLRTPGANNSSAVAVLSDGRICLAGLDLNAIMDVGGVGVRPAVWVKNI